MPLPFIIVNIICVCITVSCVLYLFLYLNRHRQEHTEESVSLTSIDLLSTVDDKETYSKLEVAQLIETARSEYTQDGREEILDSIRNTIETTSSTLEAFRGVYKDHVILPNKNTFLFIPVDKNLPLNNYPASNFQKNDDGTVSYLDENGDSPYTGIDVSSHQGTIDWDSVSTSGIDFAIIRTGYRGYSEGAILEDSEYYANMDGALSHDLHIGIYFFTQAVNETEMQEEIDFILERLSGYNVDGPIVIDVEEVDNGGGRTAGLSSQRRTELIQYFCKKIEEAGFTPMIYGNLRSTMLMFDISALKDYEMWYAYYSFPIYYPYDYSILQYSSTGSIPGISTNVDLNLCFKPWWK